MVIFQKSSSGILGGNSIEFFSAQKMALLALWKGYLHKLSILDASDCFLGHFYYCSSVPNSMGQKMAWKTAPKVARKAARKMVRVYWIAHQATLGAAAANQGQEVAAAQVSSLLIREQKVHLFANGLMFSHFHYWRWAYNHLTCYANWQTL